jgi:hypothetical protein
MSAITTNQYKNLISDLFYSDASDVANKYYLFIGRVEPWENESAPDTMYNSYTDQLEAWKRMTAAKKVNSSDVSYAIRRKDWVSGNVYSEYRDDVSFLGDYYIVTAAKAIFKCIHTPKDNSGNMLPSTQEPTVDLSSYTTRTSDGYIWKYMYTIPTDIYDKFASTRYIPLPKVDYQDEASDLSNQTTVRKLLLQNNEYVSGRVDNLIVTERSDKYLMFDYQIDTLSGDTTISTTQTEFTHNMQNQSVNLGSSYIDNLQGFLQGLGTGTGYNYKDDSSSTTQYVHHLTYTELDSTVNYKLYLHVIHDNGDGTNEIKKFPIKTIKIDKNDGLDTKRNIVFVLKEATNYEIGEGTQVYIGPEVTINNVSETGKTFFAAPTTYDMEIGVDGDPSKQTTAGFGRVSNFKVLDEGSGFFNKYDINGDSIISVAPPFLEGTACGAELILSPYIGHGYDAIDEMSANSIIIRQDFLYDESSTIDISNDFRQIGLWKNPENNVFGSYDENTVHSVARQSMYIDVGSVIPEALGVDAKIYVREGNTSTGKIISWGTVVRKDVSNNRLYLTNVHNEAGFENASSNGHTVYYINYGNADTGLQIGNATNYSPAFLKARTGEMFFIENRKPVSRSIDQTETVRLIVGI